MVSNGIKQILWHGLYDFVEMEYSLFAPTTSLALALVGLLLGYAIVIAAALFARRDYKKLIANEFASLREDSTQVQELTEVP